MFLFIQKKTPRSYCYWLKYVSVEMQSSLSKLLTNNIKNKLEKPTTEALRLSEKYLGCTSKLLVQNEKAPHNGIYLGGKFVVYGKGLQDFDLFFLYPQML